MTVFYKLADKLYVNITNRCSCDCIFCIRKNGDSVGDAESLWLEREPSVDEIKGLFDALDLQNITEIVFCGYGEPLERADAVVEIGGYIKYKTGKIGIPLRLNTNGLVNLINPDFDITRLGVFDSVSISLNADNASEYLRVTRPVFGEGSFEAMLKFADDLKKCTNVFFTVVDVGDINIEKCRSISEKCGISLRVRHYEGS